MGGDEVRILAEDPFLCRSREDFRAFRPTVAGDDDAVDGLGGIGERDGDEGGANTCGTEPAPERRARAARRALDALGLRFGLVEKLKIPCPAGLRPVRKTTRRWV